MQSKVFVGMALAMGIATATLIVGVIIPTVEVVYDGRTGNCVSVYDHAKGQKRECGWEEGKRFTSTITYPNG